MATLNENSTNEDIKNFLLFHIDEADERKSKVNPVLTKQQVWDIIMNGAIENTGRVRTILIRHCIKEFRSHYED